MDDHHFRELLFCLLLSLEGNFFFSCFYHSQYRHIQQIYSVWLQAGVLSLSGVASVNMHKNELLGRYVASSCIPNIFTQLIAGMRKRKPMKLATIKERVKCEMWKRSWRGSDAEKENGDKTGGECVAGLCRSHSHVTTKWCSCLPG